MSNNSFRKSEFYDRVLKVREFMFDDIDKTLQLVHTPSGGPNFLLALGLCCYTEYWGKLLLGIGKGEKASQAPFSEFLYRLDRTYYQSLTELLAKKNLNIYLNIRCGLAHAYLIEGGKTATIDTGNKGRHGIEYDFEKGKYTFWVREYFEEFKKAVDSYIKGLEEGTEDFTLLIEALKNRPELLQHRDLLNGSFAIDYFHYKLVNTLHKVSAKSEDYPVHFSTTCLCQSSPTRLAISCTFQDAVRK